MSEASAALRLDIYNAFGDEVPKQAAMALVNGIEALEDIEKALLRIAEALETIAVYEK